MDGIRILVLVAVLGFMAFKALRILYNFYAKKKCVATIEGKYVYTNGSISFRTPVSYYVFEYKVNDQVYLVEHDKMFPGGMPAFQTVEIKYNPQYPEICFIDGIRGRIVSKVD